jgi:hypothetical protein
MSNFDEGFMLDSLRRWLEYREQIDNVHRHCEEHLRRSNPDLFCGLWIASLIGRRSAPTRWLAMTSTYFFA